MTAERRLRRSSVEWHYFVIHCDSARSVRIDNAIRANVHEMKSLRRMIIVVIIKVVVVLLGLISWPLSNWQKWVVTPHRRPPLMQTPTSIVMKVKSVIMMIMHHWFHMTPCTVCFPCKVEVHYSLPCPDTRPSLTYPFSRSSSQSIRPRPYQQRWHTPHPWSPSSRSSCMSRRTAIPIYPWYYSSRLCSVCNLVWKAFQPITSTATSYDCSAGKSLVDCSRLSSVAWVGLRYYVFHRLHRCHWHSHARCYRKHQLK